MTVELIDGNALAPEMVADWRRLQNAQQDLSSPFFSVEFCQLVAKARDDVRIGVIRQDGTIIGFFPFNAKRFGSGVPLAGQISDYHGVIGETGPDLSPSKLLGAVGLSSYDFNHAPQSQRILTSGTSHYAASPVINLARGFDGWRADRNSTSKVIKKVERLRRKLEREMGPLDFQVHDNSDQVWDLFLDWKSRSLASRGVRLTVDSGWLKRLTEALRQTDGPHFAGMVSSLRAGNRVVAIHFGMRSDRAWHWWFPTYDDSLQLYSPGLVLLYECARAAAQMGLQELDLGRGPERFKREFANAKRLLIEGSIERIATPAGAMRKLRKGLLKAGQAVLPEQIADRNRRALNRLIGSALLK